jgi:hypothetical protein
MGAQYHADYPGPAGMRALFFCVRLDMTIDKTQEVNLRHRQLTVKSANDGEIVSAKRYFAISSVLRLSKAVTS